MEARKNIANIEKNKTINHKGDLTIDGDIEENAEISLSDGSLTILGSVKDGAKIKLSVSEELRKTNNISIRQISVGGWQSSCIYSGSGEINYTSCNTSLDIGGQKMMIGDVNINNRIFTDDQVVKLGKNKYKITPINNSQFGNSWFSFLVAKNKQGKSVPGLATATIDGKNYEGAEIIVDGSDVFVNGEKTAIEKASVEGQLAEWSKTPPKLIIHGNIGNVVYINSDADIEVKGTIGNFCVIQSEYGKLSAQNIDDETTITVRNQIEVGHVGKSCVLKSKQYGLKAQSLDRNTHVDVRDAVNINGDIGNGCEVKSSQYGLKAGNVGEAVAIAVHDAIDVNSIGSACIIKSKQYGIDVTEGIGAHVQLTVRDDIKIGSVDNNSQLESQHGKIKVSRNVGSNVLLKSHDSIQAKDVGDNSVLSSTQGEIAVRNVGSNATLTAREDIDIDGSCPSNTKLTSQKGKVRKATVAPTPKQGIFSPPRVEAEPKRAEMEVPEAYICIITQEIMKKPLFCTLDGRTYEAKAIKEWLTTHRTSPVTKKEMKPDQSIDDVLIENRNLEDAIQEFCQKRSQILAGPH